MKTQIKNKRLLRLTAVILLIVINANAQEILWHSIDGGGGVSNGNDIRLTGVIGQADTVRMTSGNTSLSGGYLPLPVDNDLIFKDSFE